MMFGGLHLEMAPWNTLGDLLDAASWATALVEAEVASPEGFTLNTDQVFQCKIIYLVFLYNILNMLYYFGNYN